MNDGVRLICTPRVLTAAPTTTMVAGGELRLTSHGAGDSKVGASEVSAELAFYVRFFKSTRQEPLSSFSKFATLEGRMIRHSDGAACFICEPDTELSYEDGGESRARVRVLSLAYHSASFKVAPHPKASELCLPSAPESARSAEVGFGLTIDGAVEATAEQCDILDVPLKPAQRTLRLRFPDTESSRSTFALLRETDGFEQTRSYDQDLVPGDDFIDLEFPGVFDGLEYSLEVRFGADRSRRIFTRRSVARLLNQ